ncbi:predicted protein [Naegleria gruberi]|uniref:Predicted protein n=1 Tax=Naegleria gruberi TaxID=5762 RepID=D2V0T6_NAEGR|nr:uncharacterized protein NAEGRDRAFT_62410 [Naegleria gruberi]EFC49570.1 predicted protein [Naegleria gruberi]|eukprot:XP_002682314.1 predicted protein [Naegleria gruberi strain NEG-M]
MPPKRKSKSDGKEETKKTKTSSSASSSVTQQAVESWKKKSLEEFKIILKANDNRSDGADDEWKIYYETRKKAQTFHKKILENDENLGMEELIMEEMRKVVQANTKLTEKEESKVLSQFLITQLEACFEDSDLDDLRSCTIGVTAYSDHSYSSIEFEFEYHFRVRGYGIEFFRSFKYATHDKPSTKAKKTVWYSNGAPSEYEEDRKFKLTLGQLLNIKELLFSETICEKLTNYEFVQLTLESIAQFGETGHVKDDDWIGYHNRMLCGCPTKEDRDYVHPTFEKPKRGRRQRDYGEDNSDSDRDSNEDDDDSDNRGCAQQ